MQTFVRNEQDDGIGPHQQMSLETYDDDSTYDVQLARRVVYPLARLGRLPTVIWPHISGKPERHTLWLGTTSRCYANLPMSKLINSLDWCKMNCCDFFTAWSGLEVGLQSYNILLPTLFLVLPIPQVRDAVAAIPYEVQAQHPTL